MKKAIYVNTLKAAAAALFFLVLNTTPVHAADKPKDVPAEVKYLGSLQGKPLFQITLDNPQTEEITLTLSDENGVTIYSDVVKEKTYSRKLQFNDLDVDSLRLKLTLRTKNETQTKSFEIIKSTHVVDDIAVVTL